MDVELRRLLTSFAYEWYRDGVAMLRQKLDASRLHADAPSAVDFRESWNRLKRAVQDRSLPPGDAFELVAFGANQVLRDNSDDEAYRWLELTIRNAERTDGKLDEY